MHPQLQAVADGLVAAQARLHRLADSTPPGFWPTRAHPDRWSAGECVAHLNLTATAFLPLIRTALTEAGAIGGGAPPRLRRDFTGWILWRTAGPPVRFRVRTAARFVPAGAEPLNQLLTTFDRLQREQLDVVAQADGRPIHMVKIASPFDPRIRYNLYACLTILPPHQERHIWQAERVLERLRSGK
ncbi:MAG TPA: DinB family protein [Gemmatimonadales bacterium]|nr:DinB family protein [Gemmatimonadales bacterium]